MLKRSAFVNDNSRAKLANEGKYYIIFSAVLFLCGALFLIIPVFNINGIAILIEGWVLLFALIFDILRPLMYNRGVADTVMAIFAGALYAILEFSIGSVITSIETYKLLICAALFLTGISRILTFTQMIAAASLPLLPVCGIAEMAAALLIFFEWPGSGAPMMYFFIGMTVLLSAFESVFESAKLNAKVHI